MIQRNAENPLAAMMSTAADVERITSHLAMVCEFLADLLENDLLEKLVAIRVAAAASGAEVAEVQVGDVQAGEAESRTQ